MTALGVAYVAGIQPKTLMWRPGTGPRRRGKPLNNTGRRDEPDLITAKEVMLVCPSGPGAPSGGGKALPIGYPRALHVCALASAITDSTRTRCRKSGC